MSIHLSNILCDKMKGSHEKLLLLIEELWVIVVLKRNPCVIELHTEPADFFLFEQQRMAYGFTIGFQHLGIKQTFFREWMKSVCYSKENNPKPVIKCEVLWKIKFLENMYPFIISLTDFQYLETVLMKIEII